MLDKSLTKRFSAGLFFSPPIYVEYLFKQKSSCSYCDRRSARFVLEMQNIEETKGAAEALRRSLVGTVLKEIAYRDSSLKVFNNASFLNMIYRGDLSCMFIKTHGFGVSDEIAPKRLVACSRACLTLVSSLRLLIHIGLYRKREDQPISLKHL